IEAVGAVGLESRYARARRHVDALEHFARTRVDSPEIARLVFPRAVPEFAIDPGDTGDEATGLDRAQDGAGARVDLVDLPVAVLSHPEAAFGPCEARTVTGRRDRREHFAGFRVEPLDAIPGDLEQVAAVEGTSRVGRHIDRARRLAACRIEGVQAVAGREPDLPAVVGHAVDGFDAREGPVLLDDFCGVSIHAVLPMDASILGAGLRRGK